VWWLSYILSATGSWGHLALSGIFLFPNVYMSADLGARSGPARGTRSLLGSPGQADRRLGRRPATFRIVSVLLVSPRCCTSFRRSTASKPPTVDAELGLDQSGGSPPHWLSAATRTFLPDPESQPAGFRGHRLPFVFLWFLRKSKFDGRVA